jgi:hypothetical protein
MLLRAPADAQIDHIDGNKLNNQRVNLRFCTRTQNACNGKSRKNSSSKYKGVNFDKQTGRWLARIQMNKKQKNLGRFDNEVDAAIAYNKMATELHGVFARLNIIKEA